MRTILGAMLLAMLVCACGDSGGGAPSGSAAKPAQPPSGKPAQSGAPKSSASAASSAASTDEKGKMAHCPAAAPGAKTEVKDVDGGVELVIKASDAAGTTEIRDRGKTIAERAKGEAGKQQHSGQGGGGGIMGKCPVVLGGTDVKVEETDGGSKITVTAKDKAEVDWLRRETKERLAALEGPAADGDRKMANCPSAVTGAKTAVKDQGGSIVVTVVAKDAKDEASVKDIRARAKAQSELKHEGDGKEHAGRGTGGGKEGRCPSVLENTDMAVKDVDGGSEITLKPKKKEDKETLLQEAQDRAKRFE
jgi:hypothetical protein